MKLYAQLFVSLLVLITLSCTPKKKSDQDYPQYEEGTIDVGEDIKLFYQRVGDGKQRIIVPIGWWLYDDFKHLAVQRDRTFIFYDVRNRARSSYVQDSAEITFGADVEDIERIRQHFDFDKISLIGSSYTGCIVILYAMKYPQHVENIVQIGAVPYNPNNSFDDSLSYKISQVDSLKYKELVRLHKEGYHLSNPRKFSERYWNITNRINLVGDSSYSSRMGKQWGGHLQYEREWFPDFSRHLRFHFESFLAMDIQPEDIKKVQVRVLTIAGTKDRNVPFGASKQWASLLPNSRFLRIRDAAHIPWIENPNLVFNSIDQFLDKKWPEQAVKLSQ